MPPHPAAPLKSCSPQPLTSLRSHSKQPSQPPLTAPSQLSADLSLPAAATLPSHLPLVSSCLPESFGLGFKGYTYGRVMFSPALGSTSLAGLPCCFRHPSTVESCSAVVADWALDPSDLLVQCKDAGLSACYTSSSPDGYVAPWVMSLFPIRK